MMRVLRSRAAPMNEPWASLPLIDRFEAGRELVVNENWPEAVACLESCLNENLHYKTLELIGECYAAQDMYRQALHHLLAASTLNKSVRIRYRIAECFIEIDDEMAELYAKEAIALSPKCKRARAVLELLKGSR